MHTGVWMWSVGGKKKKKKKKRMGGMKGYELGNPRQEKNISITPVGGHGCAQLEQKYIQCSFS